MPRIMNLDEISPFDVHVKGKTLPKDEVRNIIKERVEKYKKIMIEHGDESTIGLTAQFVIGELHNLMPSAKEEIKNGNIL